MKYVLEAVVVVAMSLAAYVVVCMFWCLVPNKQKSQSTSGGWSMTHLKGMSYEQLSRHASRLISERGWYNCMDELTWVHAEMRRLKELSK